MFSMFSKMRRATPAATPLATTPGPRIARPSALEPAAFEPLEARSLLAGVPVVSLMQMDKTASEVEESTARFGVKRSGSTAQPLTVRYKISGTADNNEDYVGLSGVIRIPAGKSRASLPVIPIDDFDVEGNETIRIEIEPVAGSYAIDLEDRSRYRMTINLVDDDVRPIVRMRMTDREATEYGPNNAVLVFTRTGPLELPLTVDLRIGGSANADPAFGSVDYARLPSSISFNPGDDRVELEIDAVNDNILEGNETVRVIIRDTDRYDLDLSDRKNWANTVTIRDRSLVTLFVVDPVATTDPGDTASFMLHRSGSTDDELRVAFRFGGTATPGVDFADLSRQLIFRPGESLVQIRITGLGTRFDEASKTVRITLSSGPQYNLNTAVPESYSMYIRLFDDQLSPAS